MTTQMVRVNRTQNWMPAFALALLVGGVFGQTVLFGWVNLDDDVNVTKNPYLNPVTSGSLQRLWTAAYEDLYVPVAYTLFAAETVASRFVIGDKPGEPPDPRPFHALSVGLHLANVLLVWSLLERLTNGRRWVAAAGAALFAVHPLQVESVAWISEQRGLLSALCALAALRLHVAVSDMPPRSAAAWFMASAAATCYGAALLSKPQVVTLPAIAFLLDVWRLGRSPRAAFFGLAPWLVLAAGAAWVVQSLQAGDRVAFVHPWLRPVVAADALRWYASKLVWPVHLGIDYGRTPAAVLADRIACALALTGVMAVLTLAVVSRSGGWRLPLAISLAALGPVLGIVPFLFQGYSTVADRYAYIAMLGPAIALADAARGWCERGRWRPLVACCGVIILFAALSGSQARHWRSAIALNEQTLKVNPESFLGACNLGAALIDADRLPEAAKWLARSVMARPGNVNANLSLGIALDKLGRLEEAASCYEAVLSLRPSHAEAHNYLGVICARRGHVAEAEDHFRRALAAKPGYGDAQHNLERAERLLNAAPR